MDCIFRSGHWLAVFLFGISIVPCLAFPDKQKLEYDERIMAIMDPVDLHTQRIDPEWGEFLRRNFQTNPKWKIILADTMASKFKDYRLDPRAACHEFQCAFDAGNILGAEFVLFGSITALNDLYAFTFNLVHVPTSQVVWSKVGHVRKKQLGQPAAALEATLVQMAGSLGPDQVHTGRRDKRGLLSVLDLSAGGSTPSRMMAERVATQLYASRNYDIMGKKEMEELLSALDINKSGFNPTDSSIFWLGGKMDITHLVYSRLLTDKSGSYELHLALYDVAAKKKLREWPPKSTQDFRTLLEFEDKFFASLFKASEYDISASANPVETRHWTLAGAGMSMVLGAAFGYLAYAASSDADKEYAEFQGARSRESAERLQSRVLAKERSSVVFGVLGGLSLASAGGFLIFSF